MAPKTASRLAVQALTDFWSRQTNQGSLDVVVAVVDTGLQLNHPDIVDSPNVAAGWDMVSDPRMGNDGDGRDSNPDDPGDLCDPSMYRSQRTVITARMSQAQSARRQPIMVLVLLAVHGM